MGMFQCLTRDESFLKSPMIPSFQCRDAPLLRRRVGSDYVVAITFTMPSESIASSLSRIAVVLDQTGTRVLEPRLPLVLSDCDVYMHAPFLSMTLSLSITLL